MPFLREDRVLGAALGISLAVHAVLMAVHFKMPDTLLWKATAQPLARDQRPDPPGLDSFPRQNRSTIPGRPDIVCD